jgi:hypothetical protein
MTVDTARQFHQGYRLRVLSFGVDEKISSEIRGLALAKSQQKGRRLKFHPKVQDCRI